MPIQPLAAMHNKPYIYITHRPRQHGVE